jgi:hypothetical protein
MPQPKTKREFQDFLGEARLCNIWTPIYSSLAKPLYEAKEGSGKDPLNWELDQEWAFQEIETINQHPCATATRYNMTMQSLCM